MIRKKIDLNDFLEFIKDKGKFEFETDDSIILITYNDNSFRFRKGSSGLMARINPNNLKNMLWKNRKFVNYELKKKCINCKYSKKYNDKFMKCVKFETIDDMSDNELKLLLIGSGYKHNEFGISDDGYLLVNKESKCKYILI